MIDINIPTLREYNTKIAHQLAKSIKDLNSYNDIAGWDKQATAEVEKMRSGLKSLEDQKRQASTALEQVNRELHAMSFMERLFASRKEKKRLISEQSRLSSEWLNLGELVDQFEAAIDFTPDSSEDLKELLKECRVRKKELQAEKKAINAEMTTLRVEARQETVKSTPGKYGKWDRRRIRLDKETALRPHENEKAAIDRQIINLDRIVAWLERFK